MRALALPRISLLLIVSAAPLAALESTDVERRSFELPTAAGGRSVEIDNVFGPVTVRGGAGDRVEVTIHRRITADDAAELERARAEVRLEVVEEPGRLELAQDGPFRDDCDERGHRRGRHRDRDYEVEWSWVVTVPSDVALEVSTVLGDLVLVDGIGGELDVANVNGAVRVVGARAATEAATVNGDVEVAFAVRPTAPMSFSTVNGEIEVALPAGSGAELAVETLNGEIYTDFPAAATARPATIERESSGRGTRFRLGGETVVRLGAGGPRLAASTVNGDVLIRER
jgi:hypothetical protein